MMANCRKRVQRGRLGRNCRGMESIIKKWEEKGEYPTGKDNTLGELEEHWHKRGKKMVVHQRRGYWLT